MPTAGSADAPPERGRARARADAARDVQQPRQPEVVTGEAIERPEHVRVERIHVEGARSPSQSPAAMPPRPRVVVLGIDDQLVPPRRRAQLDQVGEAQPGGERPGRPRGTRGSPPRVATLRPFDRVAARPLRARRIGRCRRGVNRRAVPRRPRCSAAERRAKRAGMTASRRERELAAQRTATAGGGRPSGVCGRGARGADRRWRTCPALRAGFVWDDDAYVTQNATLRTRRRARRASGSRPARRRSTTRSPSRASGSSTSSTATPPPGYHVTNVAAARA